MALKNTPPIIRAEEYISFEELMKSLKRTRRGVYELLGKMDPLPEERIIDGVLHFKSKTINEFLWRGLSAPLKDQSSSMEKTFNDQIEYQPELTPTGKKTIKNASLLGLTMKKMSLTKHTDWFTLYGAIKKNPILFASHFCRNIEIALGDDFIENFLIHNDMYEKDMFIKRTKIISYVMYKYLKYYFATQRETRPPYINELIDNTSKVLINPSPVDCTMFCLEVVLSEKLDSHRMKKFIARDDGEEVLDSKSFYDTYILAGRRLLKSAERFSPIFKFDTIYVDEYIDQLAILGCEHYLLKMLEFVFFDTYNSSILIRKHERIWHFHQTLKKLFPENYKTIRMLPWTFTEEDVKQWPELFVKEESASE